MRVLSATTPNVFINQQTGLIHLDGYYSDTLMNEGDMVYLNPATGKLVKDLNVVTIEPTEVTPRIITRPMPLGYVVKPNTDGVKDTITVATPFSAVILGENGQVDEEDEPIELRAGEMVTVTNTNSVTKRQKYQGLLYALGSIGDVSELEGTSVIITTVVGMALENEPELGNEVKIGLFKNPYQVVFIIAGTEPEPGP